MDQGNKNLSSCVVNSFMEDARKLGSSLLLMLTWCQCSKYVLDNPKYTKKFVSSRNIDLKKFKRKPSRKQYVKDLIVTFVGNQLKTPKRSQSQASESSYLKLLEYDYESNDGDAASHSNVTSSESNATSHSDNSNARKVPFQLQVPPVLIRMRNHRGKLRSLVKVRERAK